VDLGARPAHHAGDRRRALVVLDDEHLGVERADLVVERRDLLAVAGAADGQPVAGDTVEIEARDSDGKSVFGKISQKVVMK